MNKSTVISVFALCFAILFAFGSILVSTKLLKLYGNKLLSQNGKLEMESPVLALESDSLPTSMPDTYSTGGGVVRTMQGYILTTEQIEAVLKNWKDGSTELLHDPVEGQLTMEEALSAGKKWLGTMAEDGYLPKEIFIKSGTEEVKVDRNRAILSVRKGSNRETKPLEPFYSFWSLNYVNASMSVNLTMNAVTGQVWSAQIVLNQSIPKNINQIRYQSLYQFAQMAGINTSGDVQYDKDGDTISLHVKGNPIDAEAEYNSDNGIVQYRNTNQKILNLIISYTLKVEQ